MNEYGFRKIVKTIKNTNFIIFGTGSVSKRLCYVIKNMGYWKNVKGFAVSEKKKNDDFIDDKYVWNIDQVSRQEIILLAVHKVIIKDVQTKLQELHFSHTIWVYPYLHDLFFGLPIKINAVLNTKKIVQGLDGIYTHAIYYMAIEGKVRKEDLGKNLYIKLMKIFSDSETALKRWMSFEKRIEVCEEKGFVADYNIKLTENYKIILDGAHRLMLAYYFQCPFIVADIYQGDMRTYLNFSGDIALTRNQLNKFFAPEEIDLIIRTSLKLKE